MILMTPGRSHTKRRPVPSFGLAMSIGSTNPPAPSTSWTLTLPGSFPPGRAQEMSWGLTVDSIWGASLGSAFAVFEAPPEEDEHPNAAAMATTAIRFPTRLMVKVLPFSMPIKFRSPEVNLEEHGTYQPPFSSVKALGHRDADPSPPRSASLDQLVTRRGFNG